MPKQQHHPYDIKTYHQGANSDLDKELLGSISQGEYIDAHNMRPNSDDGDKGAIEKIFGEELIHPNANSLCIYGDTTPLSGTWICTGATDVNGHIVEFWVDSAKEEAPLIRIDGDIVLQSEDFPITVDDPLQIATNESCIGGEIYITDFKSTPMYFNIEDLIDNKCKQKYFSQFDLSENQIILKTPPDHPVFVELTTGTSGSNIIPNARVVFGGGGTTVLSGTYQYRIRYVSESGERTKMSVATPPIPAPDFVTSSSAQYPYSKTRGEFSGERSSYSIKIRFRINNTESYDFIEVVRVSYNTSQGISGIGSTDVIAKIQLEIEESSICDFIDDGAESLETVPDEEVTDVMKVIARAKAVRYFNQRLFFMNVEYASRDVDNAGVIFKKSISDNELYPTIDNLDTAGHREPWNFVNYKSYMRGEKYGFAVVFFDSTGERTFALPIPNAENFQMPNRRDVPESDVLAGVRKGASNSNSGVSGWQNTVRAASVLGQGINDRFIVDNTFEVFDMIDAIAKDDVCTYVNISNEGSKDSGDGIYDFCDIGSLGQVKAHDLGSRPFTPINPNDSRVDGHNVVINTAVYLEAGDGEVYRPAGFAPRYFSMGAMLEGIENIPSWATSMAIVRTEPAGKVISQGLGFYSLYGGELNTIAANRTANKHNQRLWFHSSDMLRGIADSSDVVGKSLQFASPLGLFSEFWSADRQDAFRDTKIDMISYIRILYDNGNFNPGDGPNEVGKNPSSGIGTDGYVSYGKWRNRPGHLPAFWDSPSYTSSSNEYTQAGIGNRLDMKVTAFSEKIEGRGSYYDLSMQATGNWAQLYYTTDANNNTDFTDGFVKDWHEPMYITNVINSVANVPNQNVSEYMETGQFLKFSAVIGKGNGLDSQEFYLVDERWEDCIPDPLDPNNNSISCYIYVKTTTGTVLTYLNVTNYSVADVSTIATALNGNGVYVNSGVDVHGIYRHEDVYSNERLWKIVVDNDDYSSNAPTSASEIIVKYDNSKPIRFYGGDVTISENVFSPVDRQTGDGKAPNDVDSDDEEVFPLNVPFPYHEFDINARIYQHQGGSLGNNVIDRNQFTLECVRQMVAMYTCENRGDWSFIVNAETSDYQSQSFPLVNYIMKPMKWNPNQTWNQNEMWDTDYPELDDDGKPNSICGWGGFKTRPLHNYNYSHKPVAQMHFGTPKVGFRDDTYFCTRILWSEKRDVNQIDSPGIKTFKEQSRFDISDDQGEIKFAWDSITGKGSNLYAITNNGICLLMTEKRVLSEANANQLAIIGTDSQQVILDQLWITKDIGMNDQLWRSAAEYDNSLFFVSSESVYMFQDNQPFNIGRIKYHSVLWAGMLDGIGAGYTDHITGAYDRLHNEYWINYKRASVEKSVSLNADTSLIDESNQGAFTKWTSVKDGDALSITASAKPLDESPFVLQLESITPTYALTARNFTICATDSSIDIQINVPSAVQSGFEWLLTISAGECYCFKGTANNITGGTYGGVTTYVPLGAKRDMISFPPGVDLFNITVGQDLSLSYYSRATQGTTVSTFKVLFISAGSLGSRITLDTDTLGPDYGIGALLDGDAVEVISDYVKWTAELCDVPSVSSSTFAYSVDNKHWVGQYDYAFDRYSTIGNKTYGSRLMSTYELGKGNQINGADISGSVTQVSAMEQMWGKEFVRIRIASDSKPTKVDFKETVDGATLATLEQSIQGQYYLKNYRGYEQYIPRIQNGTKNRIQGRSLIFKVTHNEKDNFKVVDTGVQYKLIK